jgi:hypothetical protein
LFAHSSCDQEAVYAEARAGRLLEAPPCFVSIATLKDGNAALRTTRSVSHGIVVTMWSGVTAVSQIARANVMAE